MSYHRPMPSLKLLAVVVLSYRFFAIGIVHAQMPVRDSVHMTSEMLDDAQLNDVFFIDSDQGWAVGDRGIILHTEDGGRNWKIQRIATACRIESVHFIDSQHGWVVGGWVHPYTHRTSCLVARTQNGGHHWTVIPSLTLPGLKHVQFHDARQGWAVGNGSALYPAGVFRTEDGGRSWVTLPARLTGQWQAADFRDPAHGVVAGFDGKLAVVAAPQIAFSKTPDLGRRPLRAMRLVDRRHGWLVGDGGLVMQTTDAGLTWQNPVSELPQGVKDFFDFGALSILENHVWIAGSPGTVILHSADAGATWELQHTDQRLPLHAMTFVDPDRGWAVGALGTILATRDGGRTWRRQRTGGTRVALMGIFSEPDRVPLEIFALQSGNEGYLGVAEILNRRDVEIPSTDDASLEDKASAALSAVGACGAEQAWRFPLRQNGLSFSSRELMDIWDRVNDGHGVSLLEELVVRKIRQWRPEVVITESASPRGAHPLAHLVNQIVLSAVTNAADPTAYPDHAVIAGLEPWTVKKVFCVTEERGQATVRLTTAQLATRLGRSVAEHAADGYAMVQPQYEASPATMGFMLLQNRLPQAAGRTDIFSGIFLQPGGEARRRSSPPGAKNLESLARAAQKSRNIEQIFNATSESSANATAWLGQLQDLTKTLTPTSAGQILFQLGQRYRKAGRLELAAQSLEQLVQRYPHHPLTESALVWLVQYYSSGELAWQLRSGTRFDTRVTKAAVTNTGMTQGVMQADFQQAVKDKTDRGARDFPLPHALGNTPGNTPATQTPPPAIGTVRTGLRSIGHTTTAGAHFDISQRAGLALNYAKMIQRGRPELFAEPWVQFPMAVAYRAKGLPRDAERFYHRLGSAPVPSDWEQCAKAELWLAHGRGRPPKTTYVCRHVVGRPRLDGQLDDAIWQQSEPFELTSAQHDDGQWPAAAMLAYDDEFLFLAVSCQKVPGRQYPTTPGPRPRDPNLAERDRIELMIDLDRDYTSYYRLVVDHRGWTGESCFGNVHWNPTWYVAKSATATDWTIEVAIPLRELAPANPKKNTVWAMGMQRIVPGVGIQSFTKPAAVAPRGEGFALMMFQ